MKRLALFLAALTLAWNVDAQQYVLPFPPTTITSPANNQCLVYQSSGKTWVNGSCSAGGGVTVTGSPTSGQVTKFSGAGTITNAVPGTDYQTPLIAPNVNLQQLGACGITDATTIFTAAAVTAAGNGQALYIPGGCTINHSGSLTLNGVSLVGDGYTSVFNATATSTSSPALALQIQGTGVVVRGINFTTANTAARQSNVTSSAIAVQSALTNFSIDHNYFSSQFPATDIQFSHAGSNGVISANQVSVGPLSNPIILQAGALPTPGVANITISDNVINAGSVGDTCIELTYAVSGINVVGNQLLNCGAYGISVIGGQNITIAANSVVSPGDRGIVVLSDGAFTLENDQNIAIIGNTVSGVPSSANASIFIAGDSGHLAEDITVAGNTVDMNGTGATAGIQVGACSTCTSTTFQTNRVNVSKNVINGDGTNGQVGVFIRGANDVTVEGNDISTLQQRGIQTTVGNSGPLKILGNHFANLGIGAAATYEAIQLQNNGFSHVEVMDNSYVAGTSALTHFVTCTASYDMWALFNVGDTTDANGCTLNTLPGIPVSANPSASIGLTAVNGTAATYTTSDSAPALSQGISPTWTGTHIFAGAFYWDQSGAGTNLGEWGCFPTSGVLTCATFTDALGAGNNFLTVTRGTTTTLTNETFGYATAGTYSFAFTGLASFSGPVSLGSTTATSGHRYLASDSGFPDYRWTDTTQGTNLKSYDFFSQSGHLTLETVTDAFATGKNIFDIVRGATTTVASVEYGNTTDLPTHKFDGGIIDTVRTVTASGAVTVTAADHTVCVNKTTGAATAANLPATPATGLHFIVSDCKGDANTNNITVTPAAGNIDGSSTYVISTAYGSWEGYYNGTLWKTIAVR